MIYTFIKISSRGDDASLDRYWIDPSGAEHYVGSFTGTHMMWIFDNQEVLQPEEIEEISNLGLTRSNIERFAGVLYKLGWVRVSENVALMQGLQGVKLLAGFIKKHKSDPNMDVAGAKKIAILTMTPEMHVRMSIAQILRKYGGDALGLVANLNKTSSRDAVKDTINYWDKAKNKDFSKYWRQLKKRKKKANFIPNPDTTVPQPLKRNYDYGEIPNYIDRVKWHTKKQKRNRNRRKATLDTI